MGTNLALVQGAYAAFGQGDIGGVLAALGDDVDWSSPGRCPTVASSEDRPMWGGSSSLGAPWQPLALEVELVSEVGDDQVVGVVRAEGTLTTGGCGARRDACLHGPGREDRAVPRVHRPGQAARLIRVTLSREVTERGLRVRGDRFSRCRHL